MLLISALLVKQKQIGTFLTSEISLGFQIRVGKQQCFGHNLPPWTKYVMLTELPNSKWSKAHPAHCKRHHCKYIITLQGWHKV